MRVSEKRDIPGHLMLVPVSLLQVTKPVFPLMMHQPQQLSLLLLMCFLYSL